MSSPAIRAVSDEFVRAYPGEAARSLEALGPEELAAFLAQEPPESVMAILPRLRPDLAAEVLQRSDPQLLANVFNQLDPARGAALMARLDLESRERYLVALNTGIADEIRALIAYPLDSAGHLMDPRVATFHADDTVQDVLDRLRARQQRRISEVFLIDADGRLSGSVLVQDLALAQPGERLETLVRSDPARIQAIASREEVLDEFQTRRVPTLPVVTHDGVLLGVIRHAALVEAAQQEATTGIQTMVGASKDERALSSPLFAVRKRLPWLEINLLTAFLAASVVGLFEETIARFTALAVLLPVVAGQSGNTGAQALAVTMRGLALREVRVRHWWRVSAKEVTAAAINGVAVALTTAVGVYFWSGSLGLTLVIGVSMVISMTLAGLSGALIPMALTSIGQDPAQSSSIILTTVTDVVGFFSFLGIATSLSFML